MKVLNSFNLLISSKLRTSDAERERLKNLKLLNKKKKKFKKPKSLDVQRWANDCAQTESQHKSIIHH